MLRKKGDGRSKERADGPAGGPTPPNLRSIFHLPEFLPYTIFRRSICRVEVPTREDLVRFQTSLPFTPYLPLT